MDAEFEPAIKPLDLSGLKVVRVDDTGAAGDPYEDFLATGAPGAVEPVLEDEEETISINYTSGTTGRPKGVMYSHRGAWVNAMGEIVESGMNFETKYLWTLPMFHCNGWCFTWAVTAVAGHARLPPARRVRAHLGAARVRGRHALQRRAHGPDRRGQRPRRPTVSRARSRSPSPARRPRRRSWAS